MNETKTVLLCGVGGQGTILAADLLARAAMEAGYEIKISEIHGMSQRGGSVTTVVRLGRGDVASMVADEGSCDCIVAFETTEALRNEPYLSETGFFLVADETIRPLPVLSGKADMPANAIRRLEEAGALMIPASRLALVSGSIKSMNVVLLGALSTVLDIPSEVWENAIAKRVPPRTVEANLQAFQAGMRYACEHKETGE